MRRARLLTILMAGALMAGDQPDNSKLSLQPPKGAIMLVDGKGAGEWELDKHWKYDNGELVVNPFEARRGCRISTKRNFTDFTLRVETTRDRKRSFLVAQT